jgi:SAM-dependent methyltransferase
MRGPRLGASYRRALLDAELTRLAAGLSGLAVDIGGKRVPRGGFRRPERGVRRWVLLNHAAAEGPDVVGSAEALPFRPASVDGILCSEVIQYVDRYEDMLAEFRRVLVPGGRVLLSAPLLHRLDHATDRHRFSGNRLRELFARAGLEVEAVTQQGCFFTTLANMLRQAAAHVRSRPLRAVAAVPALSAGACLRLLDRLPPVVRSPFLSSYTTGYLVIARRP